MLDGESSVETLNVGATPEPRSLGAGGIESGVGLGAET